MPTFIVLLGPPGAGKGTQAEILAEKTKLAHVSSGDLFRENIKNQTELGKLAKSFMDKGELVPDDVTIKMIQDRLVRPDCETGAILDGFPRTPAQADAFEVILTELKGRVDLVPYITASEEVLVARTGGRWTCRAHGHIYNQTYNPPKQSGVCDFDGSELYQRDDDKEEMVRHRIRVYLKQTMPLVEYYRKAGRIIEIDGMQAKEKVTAIVLDALKNSGSRRDFSAEM
jgi:adenylate kinase